MIGDRNENSQFSLVTQGRRQPGSSFKPFALIAALEQGIDPDTKYVSEKKDVRGRRRPGQTRDVEGTELRRDRAR